MKIFLAHNTSTERWWHATLPLGHKSRLIKHIHIWWLGPVFFQIIP